MASLMQERIIAQISKPAKERSTHELDVLLPWLRRKSELLKDLERSKCRLLLTRTRVFMLLDEAPWLPLASWRAWLSHSKLNDAVMFAGGSGHSGLLAENDVHM